ncbi:hypothetical protein CAPTEDRAFT_159025 [Capitella teleta]|uniref:non-specific serine/threonine protein kinase n=1 Tax=Capitella teleta TaxID=283909 RepID=R7TU23_CAPTE|nr:hypothetical protein CAPTEDRAFT_159025 [Capitella teleta]|eukprot:ELT97398.1 hypothetical protein CAPTEDRAFT_159025 [Capitella teleta]
MGNQLTGIAASQILPVEHYLTDAADLEYESSLGSTRFFKVARARSKEGLVVIKVFVIHDPSLPLNHYKDHLDQILVQLLGASNCLPFQKATVSDKAALLYRQYIKDSLYDRISTRPFLNGIEKRWLAFQLLCALNQAHRLSVCHGDIKSENVMVTSWNWLLLTDFASFKPTYLPEDNPADFSYFFDTSRRRTCYIAPERFVESSWRAVEPGQDAANTRYLTASEVKTGDLTPAMDIFSAGCVIAELFTEGSVAFDLSQLLAYRSGEYDPAKVLQKIDDPDIRELVIDMIRKDPAERLSAEEYLVKQRGKAFPDSFYNFLKLYLQRFSCNPIMSADDRIARIKRDFSLILKNLDVNEIDPSQNSLLVLVISLLTSCLRNLMYCNSKLTALDLMLTLSKYVTSDILFDRLLPFMLFLTNDSYPKVRAESIRVITQSLANINHVPISDANVFPEYILTQMSPLSQDPAVMVRVSYAENIALLAETALKFLEMVQLSKSPNELASDSCYETNQQKVNYDTELQTLHSMIQQKVVTLLSDPDNVVKNTLLQSGITRLCVFFGRQKANDVLVSHMITFLNDKNDWHLRGVFFDGIVGVAAYVGWQSSEILKPLLQQGLSDAEEYVIHKTLNALKSLTELGLLQKPILHELLQDIMPLFVHPNNWVRQGAVGFVAAVARVLNVADVHCKLFPLLQPFLRRPIIKVESEVVLLNALTDPLPRPIYDYVLRSTLMEPLFETLLDRQLMRSLCRSGHQPTYAEVSEGLAQLLRKLGSQGMQHVEEDKLLAMKDFMLKVHRAKSGSVEPSQRSGDAENQTGVIDLFGAGKALQRRHADLLRPSDSKMDVVPLPPASRRPTRRKGQPESPTVLMNEDWKQMFGHSDLEKGVPGSSGPQKTKQATPPPAAPVSTSPSVSASELDPGSTSSSQVTITASVMGSPASSMELSRKGNLSQSIESKVQVRYAPCKVELRNLVYHKQDQFSCDQMAKDLLDNASWENRPPPPNWQPKGQLVAHLHEHKGAINRIQVNQESSDRVFATCSNDGTVKLWDCSRLEGKHVTNRSRHTYNKQGGQIKCITFCDSAQSIASASDSGAIHVFRMEVDNPRINIQHTKNLDVDSEGLVVDMTYFDTGSQNVITYATVHGFLVGWDLRSQKVAWKLNNDPKHGLITSFAVQHNLSWLSAGTSSGTHVCWDMRFQLPITTIVHPTGARVRRLLVHPTEPSTVLSSVQGNNEVSFWDMETGARQKTLWASSAPPMSQTQASNHSANGLYLGVTDGNTFLLTAGSDMRLRYWDLSFPANSHIVVGAASDPIQQAAVSYRSRLIEGTEVVQETYGKPRAPVNEDLPRKGPDVPAHGHHDIITDINVCQTSQCFILTSARDGVIKVWK